MQDKLHKLTISAIRWRKGEMIMRVKNYYITIEDEDGNYHTDCVQALNAQDAVDTLYSEVRDKIRIIDVAVVVKNWK
jgi:ribosomal protein L20A (L18A)